jgi:MFS family permease
MTLALLKNRNFALLWSAQIVSVVGDVLYKVRIMVTSFERTGSAVQTAGVLVANMLPQFLLGPVAGAVVDRAPRQRVLVLMDLLRALLVGILLVVVREGHFNVWAIYAVLAFLAEQVPIRWIYGGAGLLYVGTALFALSSARLRASTITA